MLSLMHGQILVPRLYILQVAMSLYNIIRVYNNYVYVYLIAMATGWLLVGYICNICVFSDGSRIAVGFMDN